MHEHVLKLEHERSPVTSVLSSPDSDSTVEVTASSSDLTEAWRELLSRLPSDTYEALKEAMRN